MSESNAVKPKPGDVIWANRIVKGKPYNHCGIYEGGGKVIHYAAPEGSEISQKNAVIHRTTLKKFQDDCPLKIIEFPKEHSYDAYETVRRAQSRIGERDYNFLLNNCDHFATWCKTGEHKSLQIESAKNTAIAVGKTAVDIALLVNDIPIDYKPPVLTSNDKVNKPRNILEKLFLNTDIQTTIPTVIDEDTKKKSILDDILINHFPETEEEKESWYRKTGEKLKAWTYPIAGALEVLKRLGKLPPYMQKIDYNTLGAKVRNGIDITVNILDVITRRKTIPQALNEIRKNKIALLGSTIANKLLVPVKEKVQQVFGKAGSAIEHIAKQTALHCVPQPVRDAIKTAGTKIGSTIASGIRAAAKTVGNVISGGIKAVVGLIGGKK